MFAYVFPGQGSQFVGMSKDLHDNFTEARLVFEEADDVLRENLSRLCFEGPDTELTQTENAQPAILTATAACLRVLASHLDTSSESPRFVAGHSLGLISALLHAEAFDFASGLRLVRKRAEHMSAAGRVAEGGMVAIIGLDGKTVADICEEVNSGDSCSEEADQKPLSGVWVSNYNSPKQIVISGTHCHLEQASKLASERGAKRVVPLAVSIPCHSPLMGPAIAGFSEYLAQIKYSDPVVPVLSDVTALPINSGSEVASKLLQQLVSPVRWIDTISYMIDQGVDIFVEIGPKPVLGGLIRRIDRDVQIVGIADGESLRAFVCA